MALKTEEWVEIEGTTETLPHLMQMRKPKARTSHQSQAFSSRTRSVLRFTISVHLARESPNPARAPYRAAIVWQKHIRSIKPTYKVQL